MCVLRARLAIYAPVCAGVWRRVVVCGPYIQFNLRTLRQRGMREFMWFAHNIVRRRVVQFDWCKREQSSGRAEPFRKANIAQQRAHDCARNRIRMQSSDSGSVDDKRHHRRRHRHRIATMYCIVP